MFKRCAYCKRKDVVAIRIEKHSSEETEEHYAMCSKCANREQI